MDSDMNRNESTNMIDGNINKSDMRSGIGGEVQITPFEYTGPTIVITSHLKRDALTQSHVAAYSVGHLSNDLCAAAWFTYVLYYIQDVVKLDPVYAGFAMLSG